MKLRNLVATALAAGMLSSHSQAAFHFMQIEEIIGGVFGDPTAQAIQLRMRSGGQNQLQLSSIRAWNAAGTSSILLLNLGAAVPNSAGGSRVLLTTSSFDSLMSGVVGYDSDFTLLNPIPSGFLSGGKVTFEDDSNGVYWSVAFGAYTGTNTGFTTNDTDGNFGAPFASPLPTLGAQGIRFTGAASALSTTNVADYALTTNPATVTNNAGASFTVVPEPASLSFLAMGAAALGGVVFARRRR